MLNVIMLLSVVLLIVVWLRVVAPITDLARNNSPLHSIIYESSPIIFHLKNYVVFQQSQTFKSFVISTFE